MKKLKPVKKVKVIKIKGMADGNSPCNDCMRFGSCENCING